MIPNYIVLERTAERATDPAASDQQRATATAALCSALWNVVEEHGADMAEEVVYRLSCFIHYRRNIGATPANVEASIVGNMNYYRRNVA